jgi:nuclear pore complex protein Nup155
MFSNPSQQPSAYQPMAPSASGSYQPGAQGPSQQVSQLQQGQGGNQIQQGYRPTVASTSLLPQALEKVSQTEDPIYGPLGRARSKVDRGLRADDEISPDLADMLNQPSESNGASNPSKALLTHLANDPYPSIRPPLPQPSSAFRPLKTTRHTQLPDALHQELNCQSDLRSGTRLC